jgi:hypothetical protein
MQKCVRLGKLVPDFNCGDLHTLVTYHTTGWAVLINKNAVIEAI